jgi:hypothetical protein
MSINNADGLAVAIHAARNDGTRTVDLLKLGDRALGHNLSW